MCPVNNLLCGEDHMDMFITMFYGTLNILTGEMHYCNAGHNPPYLIKKDGTVLPLKW
ncbi:MAG: SpoIIE family protein phosphatase [Candidatus Eremiobacterota bacterium]